MKYKQNSPIITPEEEDEHYNLKDAYADPIANVVAYVVVLIVFVALITFSILL